MRTGFPGVFLKLSFATFIFAIFASSQANAEMVDAAIVKQLKAQLDALTQRLETLENQNKVATREYTTPVAMPSSSVASSWVDTLNLKGDFRYRHESFDVDGRDDRHRHRLRARTELKANISDSIHVGFGLASGGSDPTSSNQTLGGAGSSKGVNLDLAYATWQTHIDGLSVTAGKFKNKLFRAGGNGLIWDGDLRPEGVALQYDNGGLFANALLFSIDESSGGEDAVLFGTQIGLKTSLESGKLITGVGFYSVTDAQDRTPFFTGAALGNRTNTNGTYRSDFDLLEGFAEYSFTAGHHNVTLFADYVQNLEAADYDTGYSIGAKVKQESWDFAWQYRELEADAVIGTITDSDFLGGGTDGEGHILQAGYKLSKNMALRGSLFLNDRNIDFGTQEDFKRLMLDISFKY